MNSLWVLLFLPPKALAWHGRLGEAEHPGFSKVLHYYSFILVLTFNNSTLRFQERRISLNAINKTFWLYLCFKLLIIDVSVFFSFSFIFYLKFFNCYFPNTVFFFLLYNMVIQLGSGMDCELGVSRCKLLLLEWISNEIIFFFLFKISLVLNNKHSVLHFSCFLFCLMATPVAYGSSPNRGQVIPAVGAYTQPWQCHNQAISVTYIHLQLCATPDH